MTAVEPDQLAFDFRSPDEQAADAAAATLVHVMMPCMRYACGGCVCGCSGPPGRFILGTHEWDKVTCPACRAPGREVLHAEAQRQQGNQA